MTETGKTSRLRYWLRQAGGLLLTTLAVLIILTAVLVGIGRALIPYADHLRPWLAEQLSDRVGQEVHVERLQAHWPRLTPQLNLFGLRIGDVDDPILEIDQARLEIHLLDLIGDESNPVRLIVLGLDLVLAEDEDGQWGVRLEGGAQVADRPAREQMLAGDLLIRQATLQVRPRGMPDFSARLVEGEIRRRGDQTFVQSTLESLDGGGGDIRIDVLLTHPQDYWERIKVHASAEDLEINAWVGQDWLPDEARMSLNAWGDWILDEGARLDLDLDVFNVGLGHESVRSNWLLSRQQRRIQVELINLYSADAGNQVIASGVALAREGSAWALIVDELDLGALFGLVGDALAWLPNMPSQLSGQISGLEVGWLAGTGLYSLSGQADALSIALPDPLPSVAGLDLELTLAGDRVALRPGGQPLVEWPALLRESVSVDSMAGQLLLSPDSIELQAVEVENDFVHGIADGWIYLRGDERPFLDFTIDARRVSDMDPRPYLPPRYIPETAMQWLDESLHWVEKAQGTVVLHMRAGKQAREIEEGDFQASVDFSGVTMDYWPDWPVAGELEGQAEFLGSSLSGRIESGRLGDLKVSSPALSIAELTEPTLELELAGDSVQAADIAELLRAIPVAEWDSILEPMQWSGPVSVSTRLVLPFRTMDQWWIEGQAALEGNRLELPATSLVFTDMEGQVEFDRERIGPATVQAGTDEHQVDYRISAAFAEPGWLRVEADLNPARLLPASFALDELAKQLSGQAHFSFELAADDDGLLHYRLDSNLEGLALDFPAPLNKPAATQWPLEMELQAGPERVQAEVRLKPWLDALASGDEEGWRVAIGLDQAHGELPDQPGIEAHGRLDALMLSDWFELFQGDAGLAGGPVLPVRARLELGQLEAFGVELSDLEVGLDSNGLAWEIELAGESIEGQITVPIPLDSGRVLVADISRLYLDPVDPVEDEPELALQPLAEQISAQSPRNRPPLHLLIEDLRWGELNLGRARLESHAVAEGMEIEYVDVAGPDLRLTGRGRWLEREDRIHSEFNGRLSTNSLSGLLASAGYDSGLEASRAQIDAELRWPGAPQDFALRRLSGSFDLQISDGSIPEARPGAGRLLGLASFQAIPRRLMLDFRDVFGAGLKFDQVEGRFDLAAGFARTDGLVIDSPAAMITISGDTDMVARRYDQLIVVEPGLGATLPVIGILAGGPAGAAAGLVLRQILDRPLRGLAEARYSVTGSWDDPQIDLIEARVEAEDGEEEIIEPQADELDNDLDNDSDND